MKKLFFWTAVIFKVAAASEYEDLSAQVLTGINSINNKSYWNFSFSIGIGKDIYPNSYVQTPSNGFTYNMDASYTSENNPGFFINYSLTELSGNINDDFYYNGNAMRQYNFSTVSAGPRFFTNDKLFYIDAGLGYYNINRRKFIGISAGAGAKIKFLDSYGLLISGRLHNTFLSNGGYENAFPKRKPFLYYGIYLGLELNNSKDKNMNPGKTSNISIAALGGTFSSGLKYRYSGPAFGTELSFSLSKKISLIFDYLNSHSENSYDHGSYISKYYGNDFMGGLRLYLTGSDLKIFFENSINMFFSEVSDEYEIHEAVNFISRETMNYFGINFGGGMDFKLLENLSGMFKANIGTYVTEGFYYSGILGGLKYGF